MARGLPGVWSLLFGLPFVGGGVYLYQFQEQYPADAGIPLMVFGAFIVVLGLYVQFVASPEPPTMREGEEILETRDPSQRSSVLQIVLGIPLIGAGVYLYYFTMEPYVYPTVAFAVGLFLFSRGLYTYWTNTLTLYIVTNQRILKEYRFLSLVRSELTWDKVRGVREHKTITESMVGLGDVLVSAGHGEGLEIRVENIYHSTDFADTIREQL